MQAALKNQIEEREKQKMLEKKRIREEAEKEERRIEKEKEELKRKYASEKEKDATQEQQTNPNFNKETFKDSSQKQPRALTELEKKLYLPSAENSLAPTIRDIPEQTNNNNNTTNNNTITKEKLKDELLTVPSVHPQIFTEPPKMENPTFTNNTHPNMLAEFQKQVDFLKNEKQLAKEEALIYKEQLLRERENLVQEMMRKFSMPQIMPDNFMIQTGFPPMTSTKNEEAKPPKRFSLMQMKQGNMYELSDNCMDVCEKSLSSETKLVEIIGNTKEYHELYKTWKPEEIIQRVMPMKATEIAVQTNSEPAPIHVAAPIFIPPPPVFAQMSIPPISITPPVFVPPPVFAPPLPQPIPVPIEITKEVVTQSNQKPVEKQPENMEVKESKEYI